MKTSRIFLVFIILAVIEKFFLAYFGHGIDSALYTDPYSPYSIFWELTNPWQQLGPHLYRFYSYAFDMSFLFLYFRMGISRAYLAMSQTLTIMFYIGILFQDVTVSALIGLGAISPVLLVIPILYKFPFGWSWNFQDPHVRFMLTQSGFATHGDLSVIVYGILIFLWVSALVVWIRKRGKSEEKKAGSL